jgi:predicted tellurium resistance membrane protein TerC
VSPAEPPLNGSEKATSPRPFWLLFGAMPKSNLNMPWHQMIIWVAVIDLVFSYDSLLGVLAVSKKLVFIDGGPRHIEGDHDFFPQ